MTVSPENGKINMVSKKMKMSIIMPCLNEAETLETCIKQAKQFLKRNLIDGEIIVSDNGSNDQSLYIAKKAGVKTVRVRKKGYGYALSQGMEAATGKYIIIGDADASYDFSSLGRFLDEFNKGADLVMGCRLPAGNGKILKGAMPFFHRYVGNPVLTKIGKILFKAPINDFHCGLRGITQVAFRRMQLSSGGMEFASEMIIKALMLDLRISEIPITLHPDGRSRKPHLKSFKDGWRHFRLLFLYCPKVLFFYPGCLLCAIGFIGTTIILALSELHIFNITLSVNSVLIFCLSFVFGCHLIFFSILASLLAERIGLIPIKVKIRQPLVKVIHFYIIGFAVSVAGLFLVSYQVVVWVQGGYSIELEIYHHYIKQTIVYVTMVLSGLQFILYGFVIDMLKLVNES